ncbi:MAG: thiamine-phosphate kinase [Frankia sp.]|nr:thiamine-phosphate kinase [Frankia sp.]
MADETLADVGEFGVIDRVIARLRVSDDVLVGPGDDAAVVSSPDGRVVVTTDVLVEGRHFRLEWSSPYDVGRKAAAQNLADVVAMGARPTSLLVGFGAPADTPIATAEAIADGLRDEAGAVGASVVGGDTVGADCLVISVTALGDLGGRGPVRRSGARVGDAVVLIGRVGHAQAGLDILRADDAALAARFVELVDAHRRPVVPYDAALAAAMHATAMIDVSDGLLADAAHIATASGVALEIDVATVDTAALQGAAGALGVDAARWVLAGGDDHAFVVTCAPEDVAGDGVVIGRVVDGSGVHIHAADVPPTAGWDHFGATP